MHSQHCQHSPGTHTCCGVRCPPLRLSSYHQNFDPRENWREQHAQQRRNPDSVELWLVCCVPPPWLAAQRCIMSAQKTLFSFFGKAAGGSKGKPSKAAGKTKAKRTSAGSPAATPKSASAKRPTPKTTSRVPAASPHAAPAVATPPPPASAAKRGAKRPPPTQQPRDDPSPPASSPPPSQAPSAAGAVPTSARDEIVGKRVEVWWSGEDAWFAGIVTAFQSDSGKHKITYDDGDKGGFDVALDTVRFIAAASPSTAGAGDAKEEPAAPASTPRPSKRPRRAASKRPVVMDSESDSEDEPMLKAKNTAKAKGKAKGKAKSKGRKKSNDSGMSPCPPT